MACSTSPKAPDRPTVEAPVPLAEARARFAEAHALCAADGGALWGASLCGPMMLVDGATRFVVANQADAQGTCARRATNHGDVTPDDEARAAPWTDPRMGRVVKSCCVAAMSAPRYVRCRRVA